MKDENLEQIFKDFNPELGDSSAFMKRLNDKLDAVEYIKRVQKSHIRRYRYAVVVASVLGFVFSSVMFLVLNMLPDTITIIPVGYDSNLLSFIDEYKNLIFISSISVFISIACFSIVSLVGDLKSHSQLKHFAETK